jgi:hypothetical protein
MFSQNESDGEADDAVQDRDGWEMTKKSGRYRVPRTVDTRLSTSLVALAGALAVPIGLYFIFVRPRFLPEDARFTGASLETIEAVAPNMSAWLGHVFRVMGGYVVAVGVLTLHVALTTFRRHETGSGAAIAVAGISSFGTMTVVNVLLGSDFKKPLIGLSAIWAVGVFLHFRRK